ncbi:MAG: hypothetical protein M3R13_02025, partial [Armatimonadota bacterium]|nr:hypothetical protein [Armatimonadota bacterium]
MKVLILEDNLLWSSRLKQTLTAFGHEPVVGSVPADCDVAILALGRPSMAEDVAALKQLGAFVIGHAGHKEKELHAAGREAGCDRLASNSELTNKLPE